MNTRFRRRAPALLAAIVATVLLSRFGAAPAAERIEADLLIVGADEAGCAAAVQAARLGVRQIVLVNDIDWLGGQFCAQGIGPIDEWTIVDGKRTEFPASGAFLEILERIHAHNRQTYGIAQPSNGWCGANTIEPRAAAKIFDEWLAPYSRQITIRRGWEPSRVLVENGRVMGVEFRVAGTNDPVELTVTAKLTVDSTDWGDVIRLSGASYMAGPDLKSRFHEPSAPESLDIDGHREMNPISWCPLLREAKGDSTIPRPARYDPFSFADWQKAPTWVDWDGSGGIYNPAGWCIYTHRRMVDRYHNPLPVGTEAVILNWPAHDYPLIPLPRHVVNALDADEPCASRKNIVDMTPAQRRIVYDDARQRALEFLYWLQTNGHERTGDIPQSFRNFSLADDYGTPDRLPPKPYIREGLRLDALYVLREQDVRTESDQPMWAKAMVPDGVFGYQFNMDFHPTRRQFRDGDVTQPWQPKFVGARNWNSHSDRAMFPLRGLVPVKLDGLLGCSKNIGVTSMVQSSLRLHGQMMHVGSAVGTVAALAIESGVRPREIAASWQHIRTVQSRLVRGAGGPGTLIWPWHDVRPDDRHFEAANLLTIAGIWRADRDNVCFRPAQIVTRRELAGALVRLIRAMPDARPWPERRSSPQFVDVPAGDPDRAVIETLIAWGDFGLQQPTFHPAGQVTWGTLARWLAALDLPAFPSLAHAKTKDYPLTRAECVEYLGRVLRQRGEFLPADAKWLAIDVAAGGEKSDGDKGARGESGGANNDDDGDGRDNRNDPLPFDRDNDNVADRLQPPRPVATQDGTARAATVEDAASRGTTRTSPRPNVLFIMADDLRAELASYGSPALTPNLKRLSQRSVQFDRAYCQQAVCNPSRSSLLTGRRPNTLRVWNNSTHFRDPNPDVATIPLWFKEHGYATRCVGKIFHNWHTEVKGDPRSWSAPEFLHYANHGDDLAQVTGPLPPNHATTTAGFGYEKAGICECRDVPDEAYYDGRVAAEAVRVLNEVKDRPFLLAVGFWKPHAHFNAPKKYWDLYDRDKLPPLDPRRPVGAPDLAFHQSTEVLGPVATQKAPTAAQAAEMRHGYFANISYMDAQLGKVLDALERSGVADRTVIVFVSDHGYHIGEHTLWGKTSNFELDARVPLMIRSPNVSRDGTRTKSLAELVDLFPTLVELCGLPRPEGLEGTSLVGVLRDPEKSVKLAAFTQHPRPAYYDRTPSKTPDAMGVSVRTARARYTEWRDWKSGKAVARELYVDADEPAETRNVVDSAEVADVRREAERLLRAQFP